MVVRLVKVVRVVGVVGVVRVIEMVRVGQFFSWECRGKPRGSHRGSKGMPRVV